MKISRDLIIKGTAGAAAATAVTTSAIYGENIANFFTTGSFIIEDIAGMRKSLGLPEECIWPEKTSDGALTCDLTAEQLKAISFDGKTEEITVTDDKSATLTMEKMEDASIFNRGYKFILEPKENNDVTINLGSSSIVLKKDLKLEFRIKEVEEKWYLEKAWNVETIAKNIGLNCKNKEDCILSDKGKINIKLGDKKITDVAQLKNNKTGKIKLQEGVKGYYQGLKFSIAGNDISLVESNEKLEWDETYEIKHENNKWFLSRKASVANIVNKNLEGLGLPDDCKWPTNSSSGSVECKLNKDKLEKINFHDKNGTALTATNADKVTLKIERINKKGEYTHGIKIIFENTENVTIKKNDSTNFIEWKKGTNTEYKIKGSGSAKTLERAWEKAGDLADKLGIKQCKGDSCLVAGPIYVKDGSKTADRQNLADSTKSIKYEENQPEYNQGFKFTPIDDIPMTSSSAIPKLVKGATYEIKDFGGTWYLVKKTTPAS